MLHGRDAERARVADLVAAARAGKAGALLIHGEPGVGKSALLHDACLAAEGMQVLSAHGLESEAPLAFAGLHQLLRPVLPVLEGLPAPQARALRIAFGEEDGAADNPFLIALATLGVLSEVAESTPVLCVVDDAQWLDSASTDALLFAIRRLGADRVAVIMAARDGDIRTFTPEGIPELLLRGLEAPAAQALLADHIGRQLPEAVVAALLEQTAGNPLALVELPNSLTADQLVGIAPIPAQLALPAHVQRVFLDRCRRLPVDVQTLMLVAAADDSGRLGVVTTAAASLGVPAAALPEAERAGLLVTDRDAVRVRHPLVRSGVYQAATGHERRTAHRALAAALADDADRQAWHRAAAAAGPDATVVEALRQAAERAERRGGFDAASAAYARAAQLSADERPRARLLFAAARTTWAGGHAERSRELARSARPHIDDAIMRADIDRLLARFEINIGSATTAYRTFLSAARAVEAHDPSRAVEMWLAATLTHTFNDDATVDLTNDIPPRAVEPQPGDNDRTRCLRHLLASTTADAAGDLESAVHSLQAAVSVGSEVADPDVIGNLGNAALHLGDNRTHRQCFTRMLTGARDRGAVMEVLYALPRLAFSDLINGDWGRVRSRADEALQLAVDTGLPALGAPSLAWLTLLAAMQGRPDHDSWRARLDAAIEGGQLGVFSEPIHDMSHWAAGVHAANAGDGVSAVRYLGRMKVRALCRIAAVDRIEAAVRASDLDRATAWLEELRGFAEATRWPWALASVAHGQALLADPSAAAGLFESALKLHEVAARPYDHARAQLALGEVLRRAQRRGDARPQLRAALDIFEQLGAQPLVVRAEQELRATGESARRRDPSAVTQLTPMELQIAQLVATGLSNKDVAAQCWISPRTVAFHLRNVFTKTGVTSRGKLSQLGLG